MKFIFWITTSIIFFTDLLTEHYHLFNKIDLSLQAFEQSFYRLIIVFAITYFWGGGRKNYNFKSGIICLLIVWGIMYGANWASFSLDR